MKNDPGRAGIPARRLLTEAGGACSGLGTFVLHVVGAMMVAGLTPAGVLFGFGVSPCSRP